MRHVDASIEVQTGGLSKGELIARRALDYVQPGRRCSPVIFSGGRRFHTFIKVLNSIRKNCTQGFSIAYIRSKTVVDPVGDRSDCIERKVSSKASYQRKHFEIDNLKLLAIATHDLRNPIAGILAASQYLFDETASTLSDEHLQLINSIRSSSQLLLRLVDNILDASRIESGTIELDRRPTDLLALIHQNLVANRLLGLSKGIHINLVAEDCLPEVSIDPSRMSEVIDNLVTNAIKFSRPGGEIEIRVARRRNMTAISVRDQGPGIPAEQLRALFRPFQRGSSSHYLEGRGSGLGLAIAKRIVNRHGGRIEIESRVGSGSTFSVLLPISRRSGIRQPKRLLHQTAGGGYNTAS